MAPKQKPAWKQADFFYDLNWSEKVDGDFIDYLSDDARIGDLIWPHKVQKSVASALEMVNWIHETNFSLEDGMKKLRIHQKRYDVFSWMIGLDNVSYLASTNTVTATDAMWEYMLKEEPFSRAYLIKGDPKYEELSYIFAKSDAEVIILSSDDEGAQKMTGATGADTEIPDALNLDGSPNNVAPHAIVPYVEPIPLQSIPPLNAIDVSSASSQASLFNWWDYLEVGSDGEDSTATDKSTARSVNFHTSTRSGGFRCHTSRYKVPKTPAKQNVHLSSTASNSPLGKPPKK